MYVQHHIEQEPEGRIEPQVVIGFITQICIENFNITFSSLVCLIVCLNIIPRYSGHFYTNWIKQILSWFEV